MGFWMVGQLYIRGDFGIRASGPDIVQLLNSGRPLRKCLALILKGLAFVLLGSVTC